MESATRPADINSKDPLELSKEVEKELSAYRKPFEKDWREQENAYYGRQHKTGEKKKTVKNHIFKIVEGETPILTDSMPGTQFISEEEGRQDDADDLERSVQYVYNEENLQLLIPSLVRSSLIAAPGYLMPFYDPNGNAGEGRIRFKKLKWEWVYLDGNASTVEDSSKALFKIPMRKDEIARLFPDKEAEILGLAGGGHLHSFESDNFEDRDISSTDEDRGTPAAHKAKDIIDYKECWVKDYSLEPIPEEETAADLEKEYEELLEGTSPNINKWEDHHAHIADHQAARAVILEAFNLPPEATFEQASEAVAGLLEQNPEASEDFNGKLLALKVIENHIEEHGAYLELNPEGQRPKFKDSWRVIKSAGKTILYDGPNPELDEEFPERSYGIPLAVFYCYKDDTIYGFGEVKNILNIQRSLNTVDYHELENLKVSTNTGWISDKEAQVKGKLHNRPGIHIEKNKGTEVRRLEGVTVSPQLANRRTVDQMNMDDISGVNEATQGKLPSANASGVTVEKLQTQAIGRIRLKDRYLQHYSMKKVGKITASLILGNWSQEKRFRLRGTGKSFEEFVFDPVRLSDLGYSIDIAPGSMAGVDKESLNAFFLNLLGAGHIDFESFLLVADFPKKEILQEQLAEKTDQAAAMEELQIQNLKLRATINPELLTPEEMAQFQEIIRQEKLEQILNNAGAAGQPAQLGLA